MGSVGSEGAVPESGIQVTSPQPLIPNPWFRRLICLSNICYTVLDEIMECIFWRFPSKRSHWEAVIISIIISFELYSEIFKREETMRGIKAFVILAMTAFYFPIVSWGKGTNLFVLDA